MSCMPAKPARAIIVDDSSTLREVLAAYLSEEGVKVIAQFPSGKGLLQAITQLAPDIVCLDYNLPGSNGIELLKSIVSEYPNVAVVMITGEGGPKLHGIAAEVGAAGFVNKPFSQEQIAKEFRQIVQTLHFLTEAKKSSGTTGQSVAKTVVASRALVVDDSRTIRAMLVAMLSQNGIQVVGEASNGMQAVEMAKELRPDIAFIDVVMPVMDGMEALKQIRQACPATRIVMITASGTRELVVAALKEGAAGFIVKPLVAEKVSRVVAAMLAGNSV